jgi:hypothetical protein
LAAAPEEQFCGGPFCGHPSPSVKMTVSPSGARTACGLCDHGGTTMSPRAKTPVGDADVTFGSVAATATTATATRAAAVVTGFGRRVAACGAFLAHNAAVSSCHLIGAGATARARVAAFAATAFRTGLAGALRALAVTTTATTTSAAAISIATTRVGG